MHHAATKSEGRKDAGPYMPCSTSVDGPAFGIDGPGNGLGYHAAYLCPENTFSSWEEAEKAARLMNLAFREGQKDRSKQISVLLAG